MDRVERRVLLEQPIEEVWAAVTEPARLSEWIGAAVDVELRAGGRGMARRADGATRRIRVEEVEPPRRFAFRWWPFERDGDVPGPSTRVEFLLEEAPGPATRLTVTESGLPGVGDRMRMAPGLSAAALR